MKDHVNNHIEVKGSSMGVYGSSSFVSWFRKPHAMPWGEIVLFVVAAIIFSWGKGFELPRGFDYPEQGLDPGWVEGLVQATDRHRVFGTEVVFTFGPFHQVYTQQVSNHLNVLLLGRWILGLSVGAAAVILSRLTTVYWCAALVFAFWFSLGNPNVGFSILATLFLLGCSLLRLGKSDIVFLSLLCLGLVLGVLVKLSFAPSAGVSIVGGLAVCWLRSRQDSSSRSIQFIAGTAILSLPLLWLASGQPLKALPAYFLGLNMDIVSGYSSSMMSGNPGGYLEVTAYLLSALLMLGALHVYFRRLSIPKGVEIVTVSALFLVVWVVFKAGMVRHDGHAATSGMFAFASSAIVFCLFSSDPRLDRRSPLPALLAIPAILGLTVSSVHRKPFELPSNINLYRNARLFIAATFRSKNRDYLRLIRHQRLNDLGKHLERYSIPKGSSVDILNWDILDVAAGGLSYSPRPIFQSYSAFTERLQQANSAYFLGAARPDYVIVKAQAIDQRTSLDMDAPAMLSIVEGYDYYASGSKGSLVYKRDSTGGRQAQGERYLRALSLGSFKRSLGSAGLSTKWAALPPLPSGSYLEVRIRPTLYRRIATLLFKPSILTLQLRSPDGTTKSIRLLDKARNIIAVNPQVKSSADLRQFLASLSAPNGSSESLRSAGYSVRVTDPSFLPSVESVSVVLNTPKSSVSGR